MMGGGSETITILLTSTDACTWASGNLSGWTSGCALHPSELTPSVATNRYADRPSLGTPFLLQVAQLCPKRMLR